MERNISTAVGCGTEAQEGSNRTRRAVSRPVFIWFYSTSEADGPENVSCPLLCPHQGTQLLLIRDKGRMAVSDRKALWGQNETEPSPSTEGDITARYGLRFLTQISCVDSCAVTYIPDPGFVGVPGQEPGERGPDPQGGLITMGRYDTCGQNATF